MIIIEVQHMTKNQFSYINISWFVIISNLVLKDENIVNKELVSAPLQEMSTNKTHPDVS